MGGDATSYGLIGAVVQATCDSGAVRHGAECFNSYFPQELDEEYLAVWDGFTEKEGKPWAYLDEAELRHFLLARIGEGYAFPLNSVWPVRDDGWFDLFMALLVSPQGPAVCKAWYPEGSGLIQLIEEIHNDFPEGFSIVVPEKGRTERSISNFEIFKVAKQQIWYWKWLGKIGCKI